MTVQKESLEVLYLSDVHDILKFKGQLVELHTFFYWKDFQSCPICNEWLVMRIIPKEITP